jgi:hypothetical protein
MNLEYARQAYFSHQLEMTLAATYLSTKGLSHLRPAAHLPRKQKNRASQYPDIGEGSNAASPITSSHGIPQGSGSDTDNNRGNMEAGGGPGGTAGMTRSKSKGSSDDLKTEGLKASGLGQGQGSAPGRRPSASLLKPSSATNGTGGGGGTLTASPPRVPVVDKIPTPPPTPPMIPKLIIPVATK